MKIPDSSGSMSATAKILIPEGTTVTASSKFELSISGTLKLTCTNSNATPRTVAAKPGGANLVWFQKSEK